MTQSAVNISAAVLLKPRIIYSSALSSHFRLHDMSPNIKISIAQTCPLNGPTEFSTQNIAAPDFDLFDSIRQNLDVVARTVELASQNGSELVVFPEYFTQGSLDGRAVSRVGYPSAVSLLPFRNSISPSQLDISCKNSKISPYARRYPSPERSLSLTMPAPNLERHLSRDHPPT